MGRNCGVLYVFSGDHFYSDSELKSVNKYNGPVIARGMQIMNSFVRIRRIRICADKGGVV
jgi:hypothetical protein